MLANSVPGRQPQIPAVEVSKKLEETDGRFQLQLSAGEHNVNIKLEEMERDRAEITTEGPLNSTTKPRQPILIVLLLN